ncbi:hypothetical protein Sps_03955 [Shewanella psychrophila]|uniref:MatB fimbrillin n=1 Tax=Shewanella psychrophila TaxID=225848 RepID=A0A1S6HU35_9GAMM|nr:hypothetical protein [Shewanella psychrophila]AQS39070.1 hypothetical protein Sps_03955 [Shewanella psychrophila]
MKNIFKIATISALVMLSANAMAEDATQDFTWTGTVPAADATGGIKIKDLSSGATFDAGTFTLTKVTDRTADIGIFNITSASTLSFDVVTDDANEDHVDYYYTLTSYLAHRSGRAGTLYDATFNASLTANGTPLQEGMKTTTPATAPTNLTLANAGEREYLYGDEYTIQATLLITDQAI